MCLTISPVSSTQSDVSFSVLPKKILVDSTPHAASEASRRFPFSGLFSHLFGGFFWGLFGGQRSKGLFLGGVMFKGSLPECLDFLFGVTIVLANFSSRFLDLF